MQTVMIVMAGAAIRSTFVGGDISPTQSALSTQTMANSTFSHHIYSNQHGWVKQGTRDKPMVTVQAKVDIPAYLTLNIKVPNVSVRPATGPCLADTGASICLVGKQLMRSMGMSESYLTPCDMSVTGANSVSIRVLGAMLVEFNRKESKHTSKQVVYVCEGVSGALRNMEQLTLGTKHLPPLQVHDTVQVQNQVGNHPSRWDITGTVVEVKEHDQYVVKVHGSGRLTTRNRKFLKKIEPYCSDIPQYTSDPVEVPDLAPASNIRLDEASIHNDEALSCLPQPAVEPHDAGAVPALPG